MTTVEAVKELVAQRDDLDKQIAENEQILVANGVDMQSSLVDAEGFPQSAVDVYSVRHARKQLICDRNDRVALMGKIETALHDLHAIAKQNGSSPTFRSGDTEREEEEPVVHRSSNNPFAKVDQVSPMSPAQQAGLLNGDLIVQFGTLHAENFSEMADFLAVVENSVGNKIRVTIVREGRAERLELTPHHWSGRGVLGCSVVPVTSARVI